MTISIIKKRPATFNEWDHVWKKCHTATYFHSREWAEIWEKYTSGVMKPHPILFEFSDKKRALLPFCQKNKFIMTEYFSSPAGTFGGWISPDHLTLPHASLLIDYITSKYKNIKFRINPYDDAMVMSSQGLGQYDETDILNLENGFDAIIQKWGRGKKSVIRKVNKAVKSGVVIKEAQNLQDWKSYFHCYSQSLKRWGSNVTSSYDWRLFEIIKELNSKHVKLWVAYFENTVISGAIFFYSNKHAIYWHGASLSEYFDLRPSNLLMYNAIKHACEQKYLWFDFNPSGGHHGVKRFKESFKTEKFMCPLIKKQSTPSKFLVISKRQ